MAPPAPILLAVGMAFLAGCPDSTVSTGPFADQILDYGEELDESRLDLATNGVRGGGQWQGSTDVLSLGYGAGRSSVTLGFSGRRAFDGAGDDLKVFENPFQVRNTELFFMDLVVVEVSANGTDFVAFAHDYVGEDESVYRAVPSLWLGFAGRTPVTLHGEQNAVEPFSEDAGGDGFDFASLPQGEVRDAILREGVLAVRLTAAGARPNPDTGDNFVRADESDGPDIDGIAARNLH